MVKRKRIIVSVISDLVSDQRVHKVCMYLHQKGYEVTLVGRCFHYSMPLGERPYRTERIRCSFSKGIAQYAEFNAKLFIRLFFYKADLFLSNDLDTLLPNYVHAFFRKKKLVYDTHEYFTGTPELQTKPLKRKAWKLVERCLLPKIKHAYTVNASIAELYKKECSINMQVVRNVPLLAEQLPAASRLLFPKDHFILWLQGAGINKGRGAEELIESMALLPDHFYLVLIGSGDAWNDLQAKTARLHLHSKVRFIEKVPFAELQAYTRQAHLGLSLDKPSCINHTLSLPNKVFDYIHAGVPVLASDVAEVKQIVDTWQTGMCISHITPKAIAEAVLWIYDNKEVYNQWKHNTQAAANELCWQKEQSVLDKIFELE
jgi:glycosyltransferase involved in cell wall biosynthesis